MIRKGLISPGRANKLRTTVSTMKIKKDQAVNNGEDVNEWFSRETSQMRVSAETIDAIGDKLPSGMELIGDGEWVRVKGGMTLDSGCSVFVMPSQWLKHIVFRAVRGLPARSEVHCREQPFCQE